MLYYYHHYHYYYYYHYNHYHYYHYSDYHYYHYYHYYYHYHYYYYYHYYYHYCIQSFFKPHHSLRVMPDRPPSLPPKRTEQSAHGRSALGRGEAPPINPC